MSVDIVLVRLNVILMSVDVILVRLNVILISVDVILVPLECHYNLSRCYTSEIGM